MICNNLYVNISGLNSNALLVTILFLWSTLIDLQAQPASLQDKLARLKWQKRVLIVVTSSERKQAFEEQKRLIAVDNYGVAERDMEVMYLLINQLNKADRIFLKGKYDIENKDFCVLLLGKDGGEKRRFESPVKLKDVFDIIDAMPMRQEEMRNKNE